MIWTDYAFYIAKRYAALCECIFNIPVSSRLDMCTIRIDALTFRKFLINRADSKSTYSEMKKIAEKHKHIKYVCHAIAWFLQMAPVNVVAIALRQGALRSKILWGNQMFAWAVSLFLSPYTARSLNIYVLKFSSFYTTSINQHVISIITQSVFVVCRRNISYVYATL